MQDSSNISQPMKDEEATDLDWMLLEFLCKEMFGQDYHFIKPPINTNQNDNTEKNHH
jgi:hypothetical protein